MPAFDHQEWFAVVAPPQPPPATVTLLSQAIADAMNAPDVQERLKGSQLIPVASTPADAAAFIDKERQRWRTILDARTN